jgi:hypothetical protein
MSGVKFDQGKPRISLLPVRALLGVAQVAVMGAAKYGDHNYRGGMKATRFIDAAIRHTFKWLDGQDLDEESGLPHLHHAAWSLLAAAQQMEERPELDDRYRREPHENFSG